MKRMLVLFLVTTAVTSFAWAAETVSMYDQVNNAQAPVHQMQFSASRSAVQGEGMRMMDMSNYEQTAMSHDIMQNGTSTMHQDMADMYKKMMNAKTETTGENTKPFSKMNEHEEAAVVYEKADNGQSSVIHRQQAGKYRNQSAQN